MTLVFKIDPVPASRPRVPRFGSPYYQKTYATFREHMALLVLQTPKALLKGPLVAEVTFYKRIAPSASKKQKEALDGRFCLSNVDLDNLEKALYDSLQGHTYVDDCQIVAHSCRKLWTAGEPRIEITIKEVQP